MNRTRASPRRKRIIGGTLRRRATSGRCRTGLRLRKATAVQPWLPSLLIPAARAPYEQRSRRLVSGDIATYRRSLFALCLAAMLPGSGDAQREGSAPSGGAAPIATLLQELRGAGFDPGWAHGGMSA